ncbi:hypothetical protein U1Q18_002777 [Sarracenia purpurea var. burkii]
MATDDENYHFRHRHRRRHRHHLPEDALIQILVRLPVKSLLRFKCVCHHWYALIQNPSFAHDHLQYQKRNNKGRLLLQHFSKETNQYLYSLFPDETLANNSSYHEIDRLPTPYRFCKYHLVGPCNGLFCLFTIADLVILWNPSIREFRFLPVPHLNSPFYSFVRRNLGFGLDPLTGNYKVVMILYPGSTGPEAMVMVHTIGTDTWRHLESVPNPKAGLHKNSLDTRSAVNTYLDGVFYWWGDALVAFDMMKEVFREISGPDIPESDMNESYCCLTLYNDHMALQILRGWLTFFGERTWSGYVDLWVMEEEGRWIKQFTVGPLPSVMCLLNPWRNGDLLFTIQTEGTVNDQLVLCNPWTKEMTELGPKEICGPRCQTLVYYENLVSVGGNYREKGKLSESVSIQKHFFERIITIPTCIRVPFPNYYVEGDKVSSPKPIFGTQSQSLGPKAHIWGPQPTPNPKTLGLHQSMFRLDPHLRATPRIRPITTWIKKESGDRSPKIL